MQYDIVHIVADQSRSAAAVANGHGRVVTYEYANDRLSILLERRQRGASGGLSHPPDTGFITAACRTWHSTVTTRAMPAAFNKAISTLYLGVT